MTKARNLWKLFTCILVLALASLLPLRDSKAQGGGGVPGGLKGLTAAVQAVAAEVAGMRADLATGSVKPSDIKFLKTASMAAGDTADLIEQTPEGGLAGVFTVPEGKVFVTTGVTIRTDIPPREGTQQVWLNQVNDFGTSRRQLFIAPSTQTTQYSFPTGLVIGTGSRLSVELLPTSAAQGAVAVNGYLAADR